jgi:hypothetical protein
MPKLVPCTVVKGKGAVVSAGSEAKTEIRVAAAVLSSSVYIRADPSVVLTPTL